MKLNKKPALPKTVNEFSHNEILTKIGFQLEESYFGIDYAGETEMASTAYNTTQNTMGWKITKERKPKNLIEFSYSVWKQTTFIAVSNSYEDKDKLKQIGFFFEGGSWNHELTEEILYKMKESEIQFHIRDSVWIGV